MAPRMLMDFADTVYKIFIFSPETVRGAKEFIGGHYEWSWIIFMLAAIMIWNIKFWTFFRDERDKLPKTIFRAIAEGIVHWCLSNAVLFLAMEANRLIYDAFTDYIPEKTCSGGGRTDTAIRSILSKMHLVNRHNTVMVARVRNPYVPFGIMMTTSLAALALAYFTKNERTQTPALT